MTARSYLFVPGDRPALVDKALRSAADAVIVDLEDAVAPAAKAHARDQVVAALRQPARAGRQVWVRVNAVRTAECAADLAAVASLVDGLRLPKVESVEELAWVAELAPDVALIPAVESAPALLAAAELARGPNVVRLALGGIDLARELGCAQDSPMLAYARCQLVLASRAAGLAGPVNSVYPHLDDLDGLRRHAQEAARLGFTGQSLLSPRQIAVVNAAFSPDSDALAWAAEVVAVFEAAGGGPARTASGEFVDLPVALRARDLLAHHR